ncbi:type 2 lanthipeptide synthetase LanM family protein [Actinomadura sp. ATCC 31491]|uniref:Type 2 lanthipeptide synthetase LanM family protein n=1 Tax=Actinomadura luzonensis TaxID=2805427 RepID=A0ABT0G2I3_9ACTN|nr:type 2 lanthipeptide synthetase LanM family protein [Actinomadura luzonensis]MCK2218785.1 type 2 lanthipeptide synthetase LanM family protein [Actinomadura luzonensis]
MHANAVSDVVLGCLLEPALAGLAAQLDAVDGLTEAERLVLRSAAEASALHAARLRTNRVLLLELNAARISGRLTGADARARWREWEEGAATPEFWDGLAGHYPTLRPRLDRVVGNRCAAALELARRFAADRDKLGALTSGERVGEQGGEQGGELRAGELRAGELRGVAFGAGDSHRGGRTVAVLRLSGGLLVYKPRSMAVDVALSRFLAAVLGDDPWRISVPRVVTGDGYGWAEHVAHRYCAGEEELRAFYRNLGHWLAVMRLIGGSDLHAENVIACGPVPTVVDCETLFTPQPPMPDSAYGLAVDRASRLVGGSVLGTGLLPGRGLALGWRGVDMSAIGALPGQQPAPKLPVILDAGTDEARIGQAETPIRAAVNHPSPDPVLGAYWDRIVAGFTELSDRLRDLDRRGELEPLLAGFAGLPVRVVARSTETYAELARMLWHPHALHDEPAARAKAVSLLTRQSRNLPGRPDDPAVIEAEVAELLDSDVPFFSTTPRVGRLTGPRGTSWGPEQDLVAAALGRWRSADLGLDRRVIQSTLVSAYLNEGWLPDHRALLPSGRDLTRLDRRRRAVAAKIVGDLVASAIRAEDGTATWIAPVLNPTGWAVLPLGPDLYGGLTGVAVLLAAYEHETGHGRADPVPGVPSLLADVLRTMRKAEDQATVELTTRRRPPPAGGYLGLGSRVWGWRLLRRLGVVGDEEARERAAKLVPDELVPDEQALDLVSGLSGMVVPLLALDDPAAAGLAVRIGRRLVAAARLRDGTAWWDSEFFPSGLGGVAHGATGIGWALARLGAATGDRDFTEVAEAAFAYEETLYVPSAGSWRDLRQPDITAAAWCHGAAGIGVVAADRLRHGGDPERWLDVLRRAAAAAKAGGMGWNHTLCHGDLGAWEVIDLALAAGVAEPGMTRDILDAHTLGSLEEHGPVSGFAREAFCPGLLPGLGGVAYQLLRMHPGCPLPSVLLPDPDLPSGSLLDGARPVPGERVGGGRR